MKGRQLLTVSERLRYMNIPDKLDIHTLATYFTLNPQDLEIVNRHRTDSNRLGFAVQLCILRYSGWPLLEIKEIPKNILKYIANQIDIGSNEFKYYGKRKKRNFFHSHSIQILFLGIHYS